MVNKLKLLINGSWVESKTEKWMDIIDPSMGEVIAHAPCCTKEEVGKAIRSAGDAFPKWSHIPVTKRVDVLYRFRELIKKHLEELTYSVCRENGKVWEEAEGEVLKVVEVVEFACGAPSLMQSESLMNTSVGYDTVMYKEPLGVFAGLAPFNFPAMIPMGWMMPLCIATGNTFVLKASSLTPVTAIRFGELLLEAGLPEGVVNIVTCSRTEAELFLSHPDVKGITFVGSTKVGRHIYTTAAANGKRVQALGEAKNHCLVLEDAPIERTVKGIINSAFGCAGERCMALPAVVVQETIADEFVSCLVRFANERKIGKAYDKNSELGPVFSKEQKEFVLKWIEKGIEEGAKLVLDGRGVVVKGCEKGFYLGPTIFDYVKPGMSVGDEEIFGPVLCIKRVKDFEEGIGLMNRNQFANGSVIFSQNGYCCREFVRRTHAGMVGINVGIPVPAGIFPFSGHKNSFFGDLHVLGKDGIRFFTETKCVTTTWFSEEEKKKGRVSTWDGTI